MRELKNKSMELITLVRSKHSFLSESSRRNQRSDENNKYFIKGYIINWNKYRVNFELQKFIKK